MKVTILGCGRWASFHAWYQAEVLKNEVLIWGLEGEPFASLARTRKNDYLKLPKTVTFTNDLGEALGFSNYIIVAIAAQAMPAFSKQISEGKPKGKTFVLCMKGIIDKTGERLSVVLSREVDKSNNVVIWVGPGHVQEFVGGQPNLMLIAGENQKAVEDVICKFKSHLIRLYEGDDLIGAEVGAAAKNVLGIMAGILDGAHLESLKGALMAP
ncbi:MAG: glycerol-3-phosphate dehydrogenase, partial [Firmicutes bacterium]|nr:glycerol-3-phosphate dehydrogenase [Bacillota bacterium]